MLKLTRSRKVFLLSAIAIGIVLGITASRATAQPAFPPIGTQKSAGFNGTQSITQEIAAVSGKSIYLTQITVAGTAAGVFTISTGTGTNCGTDTATIYTETLIAGTPISIGDGAGVVYVVGPSLDVCVTVATQSLNGWISYAQF